MNLRYLHLVLALLAASCAPIIEDVAPQLTAVYPAESVGSACSDTIVIATFNVRNLSNRTDTARLERIASLLEGYDLAVLVEIRDTIVLGRLTSVLGATGREFEALSSDKVGSGRHWEYYGFIYDKSRLSPTNFSGLFDDRFDSFARNPGFQAFKARNFDFVAVAVHITWGRSVSERRLEINALPVVLAEIESRHLEAMGEPERDLLLLGDFNRPESDQKAFAPLRKAGYTPILLGDIKTTVGDVSAFDNIFIRLDETTEYTGQSGVDDFDIRLGLARQDASNLSPITAQSGPSFAFLNRTMIERS